MTNILENYFELKFKILKRILNNGTNGLSESSVFESIYEESKKKIVFDYRDGLTPDKLLDTLIGEGDIVKVCEKEYSECRFVASEKYTWEKSVV